ncbi:MAG: hypothetical protein QM736_18325 [Vicinamibacterales bacterium]
MSIRSYLRTAFPVALMALLAAPLLAQESSAPPRPGAITVTSSLDVVSSYLFRGIRQHATGVAIWPATNANVAWHSSDTGLRGASLDIGTWNSLHTGDTGADGPTGKLWYESDFYTTVTLGVAHGIGLGATYTAYTSPNNAYTTVKEIAVKVAVDDTAALGRAAMKPYALVAIEVDTAPGVGQADGGRRAGRYLELGVAPGRSWPRASITVPVKVGLSLADYYERNVGNETTPVFEDSRFGFASVAGVVTVPLGVSTRFGTWNLRGGVEVQRLGATTRAFNGGQRSRVITSGGIGLSY